MLRERRARRLGEGALTWVDGPKDTVALVNSREGHEDLWCVTNFGADTTLPDGAVVVVRSDERDDLTLPTDVTVWFTRA